MQVPSCTLGACAGCSLYASSIPGIIVLLLLIALLIIYYFYKILDRVLFYYTRFAPASQQANALFCLLSYKKLRHLHQKSQKGLYFAKVMC